MVLMTLYLKSENCFSEEERRTETKRETVIENQNKGHIFFRKTSSLSGEENGQQY